MTTTTNGQGVDPTKGPKGVDTEIRLETFVREDRKVIATAIAFERGRERKARVGWEVQFYLDDALFEKPRVLDKNGRARIEVEDLDPGKHKISVTLVGRDIARQAEVLIPKPSEKARPRAAKLFLQESRAGAKKIVLCTVLAEDGSPVLGAQVVAIDRLHPRGRKNLPKTNEVGSTRFQCELMTEKSRTITFQVLGTNIKTWTTLYGD